MCALVSLAGAAILFIRNGYSIYPYQVYAVPVRRQENIPHSAVPHDTFVERGPETLVAPVTPAPATMASKRTPVTATVGEPPAVNPWPVNQEPLLHNPVVTYKRLPDAEEISERDDEVL